MYLIITFIYRIYKFYFLLQARGYLVVIKKNRKQKTEVTFICCVILCERIRKEMWTDILLCVCVCVWYCKRPYMQTQQTHFIVLVCTLIDVHKSFFFRLRSLHFFFLFKKKKNLTNNFRSWVPFSFIFPTYFLWRWLYKTKGEYLSHPVPIYIETFWIIIFLYTHEHMYTTDSYRMNNKGID